MENLKRAKSVELQFEYLILRVIGLGWYCDVRVTTTEQLHWVTPEFRFCTY